MRIVASARSVPDDSGDARRLLAVRLASGAAGELLGHGRLRLHVRVARHPRELFTLRWVRSCARAQRLHRLAPARADARIDGAGIAFDQHAAAVDVGLADQPCAARGEHLAGAGGDHRLVVRMHVDGDLARAHQHGVDGVVYSNPLPSVLILTAIVVGVATLAVGLAIAVRIREAYGTIEGEEIDAVARVEAASPGSAP